VKDFGRLDDAVGADELALIFAVVILGTDIVHAAHDFFLFIVVLMREIKTFMENTLEEPLG
jgi:hypothetical protein